MRNLDKPQIPRESEVSLVSMTLSTKVSGQGVGGGAQRSLSTTQDLPPG